MIDSELKPNIVVRGAFFPEPVKVIAVVPMGDSVKLIGEGLNSGKVHQPMLTPDQISGLEATPGTRPYDGDAERFRLGIEAMRLGPAYEYDPFFSLPIAPSTRGRLRLLPRTPPHSLLVGGRSRRGQDHHGGAAHQGAGRSAGGGREGVAGASRSRKRKSGSDQQPDFSGNSAWPLMAIV